MSDLNDGSPLGVLGEGWSAMVGDYAIAGGWCRRGEALVVGRYRGWHLRFRRRFRRDRVGAARGP